MLTEQTLKDQSQIIASNDFKLPDGVDRWMLAQEMLVHLAEFGIERGLLIDRDIERWIRSFAPIEEAGGVRTVYRRVNVMTDLRSLFFQSTYRRSAEWITVPINETLYAISKFRE